MRDGLSLEDKAGALVLGQRKRELPPNGLFIICTLRATGVSTTLIKGQIIATSEIDIGITENYNAEISTNEQLAELLASENIDISDYHASKVEMESQLPQDIIDEGYVRSSDGIIGRTGTLNKRIGGLTVMKWNWFTRTSDIYMSPHSSISAFMKNLTHEFIHSWQFKTMGNKMSRKEFELYTDASAGLYSRQFYPDLYVPRYFGGYNLYYWPILPSIK